MAIQVIPERMESSRAKGRDPGFALLELLVVVLIVGLVSALVVPSMGRFMAGVRLRTTSRDVLNVFRIAREMAIKDQAITKVRVDFIHQAVLLTDAFGGLKHEYPLGKDVEIEAMRIEGSEAAGQEVVDVLFFPEGSATSAELVLRDPGGNHRVVMRTDAVTGTARILPSRDESGR